MRRSMVWLAGMAAAALVGAAGAPGDSHAFTLRTEHPRIFVIADDLPRLRARCGIVDGDNQTVYASEWRSHIAEYDTLKNEVAAYGTNFIWTTADTVGGTCSSDTLIVPCHANGDRLSSLAALYLLNANSSAGDPYRDLLMAWLRILLDDASCRYGGTIRGTVDSNEFGKASQEYPTWMGYVMAYDYLYPYLTAVDSTALRDSMAVWLYSQGWHGLIDDDYYDDHFYNAPWTRDGILGALAACHGDPGVAPFAARIDSILDVCHADKVLDQQARELNFCGTYSGYRDRGKRVGEDVSCALMWSRATLDEDPFDLYPTHYRNLDDWVLYQTTGAYYDGDETGDLQDLDLLSWVNLLWYYPPAVRDGNQATLWFLDKMRSEYSTIPGHDPNAFRDNGGGQGQYRDIPWVWIFWDDKTIPRVAPTPATHPLARYFGDLTFEDGRNSQYTHMRSNWEFSPTNATSVNVSYLCGPNLGVHDNFVNGHVAIFRGDEILTSSTGWYDSSARDTHGERYFGASLGRNTIAVMDPLNPYRASTDSAKVYYHTEGLQVRWFSDASVKQPTDPIQKFACGHVDRFQTFENGDAYLHSDLTEAYPNPIRTDIWTNGHTEQNVTRQLLFAAGKFVALCDRVTSYRANAVKRVIMHVDNPEGVTLLDGSWTGGTAPHAVTWGGTPGQWSEDAIHYWWRAWKDSTWGESKMFATVLYPQPASLGGPGRKLVRVGGTNSAGEWNKGRGPGEAADPSFEFWFRQMGVNYNSTLQTLATQRRQGYYGFWRTEIEATGANDHTFLHVYEATDAAQADPVPVDYLTEVDDAHVGCRIASDPTGRILIFSKDEALDRQVIYQGALEGPVIHHVADLVPGTYLLEELDAGRARRVEVSAASSMATFQTERGGRFRLSFVDPGGSVLAAAEGR